MANRCRKSDCVCKWSIFPECLIRIPDEYCDSPANCQHLNCNEGRGRAGEVGGVIWSGKGRSGLPLYLFLTLSVSHYSRCSRRDLPHWNSVKALCQQQRQERGGGKQARLSEGGDRGRGKQSSCSQLHFFVPQVMFTAQTSISPYQ